jgi:hypothetical protein
MKMWFPDTTSDGRLLPRLQISAFGIPQKPLGSARTVYFSAHFCPVAFFHQMIALKITLKKPTFSTIYVGTKVSMDAKSAKMC